MYCFNYCFRSSNRKRKNPFSSNLRNFRDDYFSFRVAEIRFDVFVLFFCCLNYSENWMMYENDQNLKHSILIRYIFNVVFSLLFSIE